MDDRIKNLIRKEFEIHANYKELNDLSPQFICYYFSKNLNFSLFFLNDRYFTLEEIKAYKGKEQLIHDYKKFENNNSFYKSLLEDFKLYMCDILLRKKLSIIIQLIKIYLILMEIILN